MNLFFWELLPRSRPSQPSYTPSSITSHAALTISFHLTRLGKGHDLTLLKSAHYQRAKRGQIWKGVQIYVTNECTFDIWAEPRWRHLTRKRTQSMNSLCYGTNNLIFVLFSFVFWGYNCRHCNCNLSHFLSSKLEAKLQENLLLFLQMIERIDLGRSMCFFGCWTSCITEKKLRSHPELNAFSVCTFSNMESGLLK